MILYIMGRPHSGSTILNILLGNSRFIESVGQFVSGLAKPGIHCSCGKLFADDPFWEEIRERVEASGYTWQRLTIDSVKQAHLRWFWRTLIAKSDNPFLCQLSIITSTLEAAVQNTTSKPVLCDSSKEVSRALFLAKFHPTARIVFLVRDPRACVYSHYWRFKQERRFHFLRRNYYLPSWAISPVAVLSALAWTVGNIMSEITLAFCRGRALRMRYEDLARYPQDSIERIGVFLKMPMDDLLKKQSLGQPLDVGHNIGGNRIRTRAQTLGAVRERDETRRLPRVLQYTILGLCWPLMLRYGYSLSEPGDN